MVAFVGLMVLCAGRTEVLRPFLTKLGLFPPRRNPETAPIRMEELRALVRKWNLHHKRNFWRENPTKVCVRDDVSYALCSCRGLQYLFSVLRSALCLEWTLL